jgi:c-di-GMP-binding flagellar brake protein YcgR
MSIVTSQQLARFYEQYKSTDVTFNKQVISATGLVSRSVYLKVQDRQIPCTVFSSSMSSARLVASVNSIVIASLKQVNNRIALRWCFKQPDKVEPIAFFVSCHPSGFTHYAVQGPDVHFITVEFTQRPPDDLIQVLGTLLEASSNSQRRKDERVIVTPETMKKLGLETREAELLVEGATIRCVLRDLSFSGAKVVASGRAELFNGKKASLRIARGEQAAEMTLPGSVLRVDEVGGRKDILAVSLQYSAETPMTYKLLINSYVSSARKASQDAQKLAAEQGNEADEADAAAAPGGIHTTETGAEDKTPDG